MGGGRALGLIGGEPCGQEVLVDSWRRAMWVGGGGKVSGGWAGGGRALCLLGGMLRR